MPYITLFFLGPCQVKLEERSIVNFRYEKVRLLLIYLVMNAADPQSRETLAALLWPNQSEARSNLRKALSTLRQVLGEEISPFLLSTRNTIQFNPHSNYSLDVGVFTAHLHACTLHCHPSESCFDCTTRLQQAIAVYRGSFLEQVSLPESEAFEEWVSLTRDRLHRQVVKACMLLTESFEQQQSWEQAKIHAQRLLDLEPTLETAHQSLMRILNQQGQRTVALQQFDRCCQILKADLGTEPLAATIALFEQIRAGALFHSAALTAIRCGGLACIQHGLGRYLLFRNGVVPWNYAQFLDHAADRILLRKVGGGYIFIHRLLLEHFALQNRTELPTQ